MKIITKLTIKVLNVKCEKVIIHPHADNEERKYMS